MQFTVAPSDKARQLLLLYGVPRSLLGNYKLDIASSLGNLEITGERRSRIVLVRQQRLWFRQIYQELPTQPKIIVCTSREFYLQARRVGLLLFWRYLEFSLNYPKEFANSRPVWYLPDLGFRNRLLEAYKAGEHDAANLVVIDNIYEDMPAIKLDKVRDLLQYLCDRPRLLIIHGTDPYNYCLQKLGVRPTQIFNFARQLRREIV